MTMTRKMQLTIAGVLFFGGLAIIWAAIGWNVTLGVFFVSWGMNMERKADSDVCS